MSKKNGTSLTPSPAHILWLQYSYRVSSKATMVIKFRFLLLVRESEGNHSEAIFCVRQTTS